MVMTRERDQKDEDAKHLLMNWAISICQQDILI